MGATQSFRALDLGCACGNLREDGQECALVKLQVDARVWIALANKLVDAVVQLHKLLLDTAPHDNLGRARWEGRPANKYGTE